MISIDDKHPDLPEFITHKSDLEITQGANMSIRMSDEFFDAVKEDKNWIMSFTRKETGEVIERTMKARELMNLIAETNHSYAEPGMLYWSRIENYNLMSQDSGFKYAGTNPCAEEPLPAGGSCLLGSMNLAEYYKNGKFQYSTFDKDVKTAVICLNEILDEGQELHPLPEQRKTVSELRQIGLGFMGLADLFIRMKLKYGSDDSIKLIHKIGYHMIFSALQQSCNLAREKGAFDSCDPGKIISSEFFINNVNNNPCYNDKVKTKLIEDIMEYGLRNSQLLTCAPTGTISTIFNVSGGIEPLFALQFARTTKSIYKEDKTYTVYPKAVSDWMDENEVSSLEEIEFPDYLITSRQIDWKDRINVQAAWQQHIDASISATINLPESTTVDEVKDLYIYAHDAGLKGVTVYRENCKRTAILMDTFNKKEEQSNTCNDCSKCTKCTATRDTSMLTRAELGDCLPGNNYYRRVACGHIYIEINRYKGRPIEVFMKSSKSGGCSANTEALGRLASTMLRSGIDPEIVIDSTLGIKCSACSTLKGKGEQIDGLSCSDVMARVIREEYNKYKNGYYANEGGPSDKNIQNDSLSDESDYDFKQHSDQENIDNKICPDCGASLISSEGCLKCISCGFSKC